MHPESHPGPFKGVQSPLLAALLCPLGGVIWSAWAWLFLRDRLASIHVFALPMAPCTLLGMALLASAFLMVWRRGEAAWRWACLASALVFLLALLVLLAYGRGSELFLERWLVADPLPVADVIRQELKLLGRMSPISAVVFLLIAPVPPLLLRHRQAAALLALAALGAGLLLLLGFVMGTPLIHGEGLSPTAFLSDLAFLSLGAGALLSAGFEVRPLSLFILQGERVPYARRLRFPPGVLLVFLLVVCLVFGAAAAFLRVQRRAIRSAARTELATVADLKSQQIASWAMERRSDATVLAGSPLIRVALGRGRGLDPAAVSWIGEFQAQYAYQSVAIFDARGGCRLQVPQRRGGLPRLPGALARREVLIEDFHQGAEAPERVRMVLWAPVLAGGPGSRMIGALRLEIDHAHSLAPLLQTWPSPSRTAETLLGRREGPQVFALSASRQQRDRLLGLRRDIDERSDLPSVQAALGRTGEMEGRDARGVPVLAALRSIPGTPWFMVAKVDQSEIMAPLRAWGWITTLLACCILGVTGLGISLQVRRGELRAARRRLELERSAKTMAERFHHLMREASDIILLVDRSQVVLEANRLAEERYGVLPGGLQGLRLQDLLEPGSESAFGEGMEILDLTGSVRLETLHKGARGRVFAVALRLRLVEIDGTTYILAMGEDITERKAHEAEIERLSGLYASLSRINQAIVHLDSREAIFTEVCRALVESGRFQMAWVGWLEKGACEVRPVAECGDLGGYLGGLRIRVDDSPEGRGPTGLAMRGRASYVCNDLFTDPVTEPWRALMARQGFLASAAFPIMHGGEVRGALSVYARESGVFGPKEVALLEEAARDIAFALDHLEEVASRLRAEEELRFQAEQLRLAAASAQLGIWELDLERGMGRFDERMGEIYGVPGLREFPLACWDEMVHPEERERVQAVFHAALRSGSSFSIPFRILRPDGQVRVLRGDGIFLKGADGQILRGIGLSRDMTDELRQEEERRSLQIQLHQSQKLESLGILAGGVAHDMNNVLGAILSQASAEREALKPGSPTIRSLDVIIKACMRGRGVVKGLLCFARQDLEERRSVDLNTLAREMVQLLAYTTLKRVAFELDLQEPLGSIQGDPGALSHALMNLCINAVDAMPRGGGITMRTRAMDGGWVQLSVQDTGEGMPPEVLEKAVEPFFTTKPVGKGTGLGLSMVFGTMKAHGGDMEIQSAPGRGTEIRLRFPVQPTPDALPEESSVQAAGPAPDRSRPLHILVVDDDELIRESLGPMLELLGHQPELASGGMEALEMLGGGLEVDLVILDMNMPGLNGAETLNRILAMRPEQAVLMSSGYSPEDIGALLNQHSTVRSIQKPFTMRELEAKLAAAVGG